MELTPNSAADADRTRRFTGRRVALAIGALVLLGALLVLAAALINTTRHVSRAHDRLERGAAAQLARPHGAATTVLLIGDDTHTNVDEPAHGGADSVQLVRMAPGQPLALLALSRDMYLDAPRQRGERVTSLYRANGLPALMSAIARTTDMRANHVAVLRIAGLRDVVNTLGGITVRVDAPIDSNSFDGRRWRFAAGKQSLTGARAVAFARVRSNDLRTGESDSTRAARQQLVVDGILDKLTLGAVLRHPFALPDAALSAVATDASTTELVSLARQMRAARARGVRHCRLGGELRYVTKGTDINGAPASRDGIFLVTDPKVDARVIRMWRGSTRPKRVLGGAYPAGCTTGTATS